MILAFRYHVQYCREKPSDRVKQACILGAPDMSSFDVSFFAQSITLASRYLHRQEALEGRYASWAKALYLLYHAVEN